jgi:hypothetical protein
MDGMKICMDHSRRYGEWRGPLVPSLLVLAGAIFLVFSVSFADVSEEDWILLNRDDHGNLLYIMTSAPSGEVKGSARIMLRFIMNGGKTTMYFTDEIDCERNMVWRIGMRMHNPTCLGEGEPLYEKTFQAEWDVPAEGNEKNAVSYVCGHNPAHSIREDYSAGGK